MTNTNKKTTYTNEEERMEATVTETDKGYRVNLKDLDSGNILPICTIYPDEKKAIEHAKEIAGVK